MLFSQGDSTNAVDPFSAVLASLRTAGGATLLAMLVGGMAAFGLAFRGRGGWLRSVDALMLLPLGTSAVTVGLGMLLAFGRPPLDLRNTGLLIVLAQALVAIPFVVRVLAPALSGFDRRYLDAAAVLGRSPVRALAGVAVRCFCPLLWSRQVSRSRSRSGNSVPQYSGQPRRSDPAGGHLAAAGAAWEVTVAAAYAASAVLMLITAAVVVGMDRVRLEPSGGVLMLSMTAVEVS